MYIYKGTARGHVGGGGGSCHPHCRANAAGGSRARAPDRTPGNAARSAYTPKARAIPTVGWRQRIVPTKKKTTTQETSIYYTHKHAHTRGARIEHSVAGGQQLVGT